MTRADLPVRLEDSNFRLGLGDLIVKDLAVSAGSGGASKAGGSGMFTLGTRHIRTSPSDVEPTYVGIQQH